MLKAEAVPKQILKCMQEEKDAEGLSRNNVASHLQVIIIYINFMLF